MITVNIFVTRQESESATYYVAFAIYADGNSIPKLQLDGTGETEPEAVNEVKAAFARYFEGDMHLFEFKAFTATPIA